MLNDNTNNVSYKDLGAGTSKVTKFLSSTSSNRRNWTWVSKIFQWVLIRKKRKFKKIIIPETSSRIKVGHSLDNSLPSIGSQLSNKSTLILHNQVIKQKVLID